MKKSVFFNAEKGVVTRIYYGEKGIHIIFIYKSYIYSFVLGLTQRFIHV